MPSDDAGEHPPRASPLRSEQPTGRGVTTAPVAVERAKQVFRFLKAFAERNVPARHGVSEHHWLQRLRELPEHPSIVVGEVQLAAANDAGTGEGAFDPPLITITRPAIPIVQQRLEDGPRRYGARSTSPDDPSVKPSRTRNPSRASTVRMRITCPPIPAA